MQDIPSIGGGGRLFGVGGDRRLRPHNLNHQALKCPRCDSLNTKFCYYNNYNLSQPRHFCKSCRRYWTKGGVLRNVPVGGGCRKTKRSKPKSMSDAPPKERKSNSHSSSESSSLTATTTTAMTTTPTTSATTEVVSAASSNSASTLLSFPESRYFNFQPANPNFDPPLIGQLPEDEILPEIANLTSLMTSSNDPSLLEFNITDISPYRLYQNSNGRVLDTPTWNQLWYEQQKMMNSNEGDGVKKQELTGTFIDQTSQMEFSGLQHRTSNGGIAALEWPAVGNQGLFDLTATVDQAYWNQDQWADNDHSLNYLP